MIWIGVLLVIGFSILEGFSDARQKDPEHWLSATLRVIFITSFVILMCQIECVSFGRALSSESLLLGVYWLCFELAYNYERGKSFDYVGKTAKLDRFITAIGMNGLGLLGAKLMMILMSILLYNHFE